MSPARGLAVAVCLSACVGCGGSGSDSKGNDGGKPPVDSAPTISFFTATNECLPSGPAIKLYWSVFGAQSLAIDQGVGTVTGQSRVVPPPTGRLTYRLTATSPGGAVATRTATPDGANPPPVSPAQIFAHYKGFNAPTYEEGILQSENRQVAISVVSGAVAALTATEERSQAVWTCNAPASLAGNTLLFANGCAITQSGVGTRCTSSIAPFLVCFYEAGGTIGLLWPPYAFTGSGAAASPARPSGPNPPPTCPSTTDDRRRPVRESSRPTTASGAPPRCPPRPALRPERRRRSSGGRQPVAQHLVPVAPAQGEAGGVDPLRAHEGGVRRRAVVVRCRRWSPRCCHRSSSSH